MGLKSKKLYTVFLKFISSSLVSFLVDYLSFLAFIAILSRITNSVTAVFWAGIISRVLSSAVNYLINRKTVFKSDAKFSAIRYYILAAVQMLVSAAAVALLHMIFHGGAPIFKIIVDSLLFFGSFTVQHKWVFAT